MATSVEMMKEPRVVGVRDEAYEGGGGGGAELLAADPTVMVTFWPRSQWSPTVQMK